MATKNNAKITTITVAFLWVSLLVPSVKLFFVLAVLYIAAMYWLTKSWEKVVVFGFWPLSLYQVGQLYVFRVIEPWELNHPLYPDGRSIFFKITPFLVFSIAAVISFGVRVVIKKTKSNWLINWLLVVILFRGLSQLEIEILPWWVDMANFLSSLAVVVWMWWLQIYLTETCSQENRQEFWRYFAEILKTIIIIGSLLVLAQGIKGSPLGLTVEQSKDFPYFGSGSDEQSLVPRPIGLATHANFAAYSLLVQMLTWFLVSLRCFEKDDRNIKWWWMLPLVAILWLQSRAVYLALIPILVWALINYWSQIRQKIISVKFGKFSWAIVVGLVSFCTLIVLVRFWSSVVNIGGNSGWDTRKGLEGVAWRLFSHHMVLGIGSGNFIPVAFHEDLTGFMISFPESVHNGFLLILTEQGILGFYARLVFLYLFIKKWLWNNSEIAPYIRYFVLVGLLAHFIVMTFQPFSDMLTVFVLVGVILLSYGENRHKNA